MFRLLQNNCPDSCIFLSSGPTEGKSNDHINALVGSNPTPGANKGLALD